MVFSFLSRNAMVGWLDLNTSVKANEVRGSARRLSAREGISEAP